LATPLLMSAIYDFLGMSGFEPLIYLQSWGRGGGDITIIQLFLLTYAQKLVFLITKCSHKIYNYWGAGLFSLAAKFLCRTGRKVPSGFGKTAKHCDKRLPWLTLCILHS